MSRLFPDLLHWEREGTQIVGSGGPRFAFTGADRLARMDALWQQIMAASPQAPIAFVAGTFDDSSALPSVLRLPAAVRRASPDVPVSTADQLLDPAVLDRIAEADPLVSLAAAPPSTAPGHSATRAEHRQMVAEALRAIEQHRVRKVVVGRDQFVDAADEDCRRALGQLARAYPSVWTFAVDGLFGATPELLLAQSGARFRTRVLAGTAGQPELLLSDDRRRLEHRLAAEPVVESLTEVADLDDPAPQPQLLQLPNLWHLATDISGRLRDSQISPLALVARLHPTPAVAGVPRREAVELINQLETRDRGRYAGPVGWIDGDGNAEIGLALRCGQLEPGGVRLYAAGGIVAGADPSWEYTETEVKIAPMLQALAVAEG